MCGLALSSALKRTYIDTMLFVYQLATDRADWRNQLSSRFFGELENGAYEGVITTFTYAEYLAVMKVILSKGRGATPSQTQIDELKKIFGNFVEEEGIEVLDADDLSTSMGRCEIFRWGSDVIDATGTVRGSDQRWRGIGGADAIHVVLASRAGAELLATFDQGFKAMQGLPGSVLRPLIIPEVYQP